MAGMGSAEKRRHEMKKNPNARRRRSATWHLKSWPTIIGTMGERTHDQLAAALNLSSNGLTTAWVRYFRDASPPVIVRERVAVDGRLRWVYRLPTPADDVADPHRRETRRGAGQMMLPQAASTVATPARVTPDPDPVRATPTQTPTPSPNLAGWVRFHDDSGALAWVRARDVSEVADATTDLNDGTFGPARTLLTVGTVGRTMVARGCAEDFILAIGGAVRSVTE